MHPGFSPVAKDIQGAVLPFDVASSASVLVKYHEEQCKQLVVLTLKSGHFAIRERTNSSITTLMTLCSIGALCNSYSMSTRVLIRAAIHIYPSPSQRHTKHKYQNLAPSHLLMSQCATVPKYVTINLGNSTYVSALSTLNSQKSMLLCSMRD